MDYKRLPYGVAHYTWIKSQNRYCADKTMFIPKMEEQQETFSISSAHAVWQECLPHDASSLLRHREERLVPYHIQGYLD